MSEKKNIYRRYALALATFSIAISIGFLMQTKEANSAARAGTEPSRKLSTTNAPNALTAAPSTTKPGALPSVPEDFAHEAELLQEPVILLVSRDLPVGMLPAEEATPQLGCDAELTAEAGAGAMVLLSLSAPCLTGEKVTIHHEALRFSDVVSADGTLQVNIPALSEHAVFAVVFANGDGETAQVSVSSVPFYDRAAVVWRGESGLQLHAREFGAPYGGEGHVWGGAARDVAAVAGGAGGFLTRLGNDQIAEGWNAEVYTFPTLTTKRYGDVALSIEAEVSATNCNRDISATTMQIREGGRLMTQEINLSIPECDAKGEFLVLKNLLEDLKIAQIQ
ncbi:translocase [Shimia sp. SDUM112013]|uniref:translocase n=1 Tax=Shimia sp. SDUM112013 TaxID=3136160 RepID=UPI0032EAEECE